MTQANSVDTLTEFLTIGDTHYYIFDLGRLVQQIANTEFALIEAGQQPYPTPLQQHAWLGIVFWHKNNAQSPYIWFAKFPLDERGLISHGARQHYLQIIVEALGRDITAPTSAEQDEILKQNPYIFTPAEDKRAAFHAKVSYLLEQPASIYFEDAEAFILGKSQPADWQQLGLQGLHDVAVRLNQQPKLATAIHQHFDSWPAPFQKVLCETLEQHPLPSSLQHNLTARLQQQRGEAALPQHISLLRALSSSVQSGSRITSELQRAIRALLDTSCEPDLLVILAARLWPLLEDDGIRTAYLNQLATQPDLFPHLFADLVALPALRPHLLLLLHSPDQQSEALQSAITAMKTRVQRNV
ncbi:DUF3549 family protein [Aliidiomarina soli]|uniref:DUF3549 domain-containing protein n=1 Tax=Aliidiomarina soli TaxID=1928574 RepID=A0A432WLU3_9GAMM|nr:DUF3549 family protein [Aliidiomarina soli]RUO34659.1 DUF3549 domain-containing protein [Aliidiomarina soli]